ncbi:fec operon regulator FecR [Janthinobacterium sp. HH103]|uniref:FecR domain-containing protein n=1 Tax=unclassified Janthinobacterium TaxID=2610881 RepID=UPI000874B2AB|nr:MULTISPECIES: FecR domain-containing protein [unclassified Janthinobacterium]OEZ67603.1 fec operon regulator FecR [Janthinobacterium sp. HH100]OEZ74454.1 fec operon regulator FecR [Janthinobacterium sp. HH103]OEZ95114.1 fec operon regulator FecR [Janthinobacterium sp. HH107]QOU71345.1 Protein FecR [Janthinobacterium sp. HH102]
MDVVIAPAIVQQAAQWMARLWSDDASDEDRVACARWCDAHPHHAIAWQRLQAFEGKLHSLPRDAARHALREPAPAAYLSRRRALKLLAVLLPVGGMAYLLRGTEAWQVATAGHGTATGEIREIILPDGTRVMLASASAIDVRFDASERLLVLRAGEILVTTAHDPAQRPFRVQGRHGTVRALGTRFTLRQDEYTSRVAVFEGAVEIRLAHAPGNAVGVATGYSAIFSADIVQSAAPVPASAAAWSKGVLVADNMRLDALIAELARYRPGLLRCDPAVASLSVNGVFPLRDTDRALHNLALALPVQIVARTRYWVTVQAAA